MKIMRFLLTLIPLLASGATVNHHARLPVGGPVLGYVYDPGLGAFRALRGIPGAALVDGPANAGFTAATGAVAPGNDMALAVSAGDGLVRVVRLGERVGSGILDGAMPSPDRIVFSPSGSAAILWSRNAARLQKVTGLPESPVVADLEYGGTPEAMAISDDGATVLIAAGDALTMLAGSAAPVQLPVSAAAAAFRRGSGDALTVSAGGDVYLVGAGGSGWRLVHAGESGTANPAGVQVSDDGKLGYVASAGGTLSILNLDTGEAAAVVCNCRPTALAPLTKRSVFRVTDPASPLVWLFDASQAAPGVWFVPSRSAQ